MRYACLFAVCTALALPASVASAQVGVEPSRFTESGMDSRMGELEAEVVALRHMLDQAMVSNHASSGGCATCNVCPHPCRKSCGPESCCGGLFVTADYLYWRATQNATPYAGSASHPSGSIDDLPINSGASLTSELVDTRYDRNSAFRINFGYMMSDCWDIGFRYTYFRTNGFSSLGDASLDTDSVLANRLDRNLANLVLDSTFDDGYVDFASQSISLRYSTYDLELGRYLRLNSRRLAVRALGGFRFAEINQNSQITYQSISGNSFLTSDTTESIGMSAWGLRVGGETHYLVGWGFSAFARGYASLLYADFDTQRIDLQKSSTAAGIRDITDGFQHLVPVAELNLGLRWQRGGFYVAGGYDMANWFNMVQGIDATLQDDVDGTSNNYRIDRRDLSLDGFFVEAGLLF